MENTNTTNTEPLDNGKSASERTFTQEEVNRIVQERLSRAKEPSEHETREKELAKRENALYLKERALDVGISEDIVKELEGMDKETIDKVIKIISPYLENSKEPIHNIVSPTEGVAPQENAIKQAMGIR